MTTPTFRLAPVYYALAVIGFIATWYYNGLYLLGGGGLRPSEFFGTAFANALTTAITIDVYCAAVVFSIWIVTDSKRVGLRWPWFHILVCFFVGLAVAFPLYLAQREKRLDANRSTPL
jgi:uncharacterized membrane protein